LPFCSACFRRSPPRHPPRKQVPRVLCGSGFHASGLQLGEPLRRRRVPSVPPTPELTDFAHRLLRLAKPIISFCPLSSVMDRFPVLQMRESLFFRQEFSDQREANQSCSSGSSLWLRPLAALCSLRRCGINSTLVRKIVRRLEERSPTMRPNLVLFALLAVVLTTSALAAPPSSMNRATQEQADVDLAPADESVVVDQQPMAGAIAPQPYAMGSYGGYMDSQAARKCQCAQYFGGYGPLWETYCYEKHMCGLKGARRCGCGQTAACGHGCSTGVRPLFKCKRLYRGSCDCCDQPSCHTPRLRRPLRDKGCHVEAGCDCLGPVTKQLEVAPDGMGSPPAPEPSEDGQVTPPPPVNVEASTAPSSRRAWSSRTVGLLPSR
jgi:hypothetical protein